MTVDPACRDTGAGPPDGGTAAGWTQWSQRRGLERRLHDGAALRLSALALQLGLVRHRLPDDDVELHGAVDDLQGELHAVLQELRGIAAELYPPLLDEAGLGPALREESARRGLPVTVEVPDDRFGPSAEGAAYFAVVAALDPCHAERLVVTVRRDHHDLLLRLDGLRPAGAARVRDTAGILGGSAGPAVGAGPGTVTITARFPCG
ncbi:MULTISPECIES: histidine kinase [unclassified Pseudonocardia]|uniref:histidine kinase n=1 Tax=unclassified Pseudonocardia TaxID=2619320 RepID=UPI0001FFE852|nr:MULTISPECIES: histidine kinase [unclassified Pseudonocardia]OLM20943.1 putative two-component system sensor kinase [Pseudonocardia sp. Ae707_Ps1]